MPKYTIVVVLQLGEIILKHIYIGGKARVFNKTGINTSKNYIPNKYVIFNYKDLP